jgi:predicted O-methyltransferase YrrM
MKNIKGILITLAGIICATLVSLLTLCSNPFSKPESIDQIIQVLPDKFKGTLLSMYDGQDQLGLDGNMHKLDLSTKITPMQGMCIYNLCQEMKPQKTLEIGFAYGFSTLYFLAYIESNNRGIHTAIDPFEEDYWHGIGLQNIKELNMESSFQFIPDYDLYAIPELAKKNQKFDVIFIDGDHRFDYVLLDFTLCDHILSDNGYIIFHDVGMPAIKKVVRFIYRNRLDYQVQKDIHSSHMLVFKKISDDQRKWNHYSSF